MIAVPLKAVVDANVLFPFSLRDTLLRAAAEDFFQIYWSDEILNEVTRNLVAKGMVTAEQAARLRAVMIEVFPEAMISGYEPLVPVMPNHGKDRHVAAVAVKAGAQVIVTNNLKDFQLLPNKIEAQSPDEFLSNLFERDPDKMADLIHQQAKALQNPPRTFEDLLKGLAKIAPNFAEKVADHAVSG